MYLRNRQLPNPIFSSGGRVSVPGTSYDLRANSKRIPLGNIKDVNITVENEITPVTLSSYSQAGSYKSSSGFHNSSFTPISSNIWPNGYAQNTRTCSNNTSGNLIGIQGGTCSSYYSQPMTKPITTQVTDMATNAAPLRMSMSDTELFRPSQSSINSIRESEEIVRLKQRILELEREKQETSFRPQQDMRIARVICDRNQNYRDVNMPEPYETPYVSNTSATYQPEPGQPIMNLNCENRNDPDLVQAFLKKWWVESDFKAPNLPLSLRLKVSGCHYNSIYNNT